MHTPGSIAPIALAAAVGLVSLTAPARAEDAFIFKGGVMRSTHDEQSIDNADRGLASTSDNTYAVAWEKRLSRDHAMGVELVRFNTDWQGPGAAKGEIKSRIVMFTVKRYLPQPGNLYPFVGVGIGGAHATVSGLDFDPAIGLALQVGGGIEWRGELLGLYGEVKGLYANPGNAFGDDINNSGVGAFAGVSLRF